MSVGSDGRLSLKDSSKLDSRLNRSAFWFYWIAILGIVHGGALAFRLWNVSFIGLGVTRVIDQTTQEILGELRGVSPFGMSVLSITGTLAVSAIFIACGYLGMATPLGFSSRDWLVCFGCIGLCNDTGLHPVDLACLGNGRSVSWTRYNQAASRDEPVRCFRVTLCTEIGSNNYRYYVKS